MFKYIKLTLAFGLISGQVWTMDVKGIKEQTEPAKSNHAGVKTASEDGAIEFQAEAEFADRLMKDFNNTRQLGGYLADPISYLISVQRSNKKSLDRKNEWSVLLTQKEINDNDLNETASGISTAFLMFHETQLISFKELFCAFQMCVEIQFPGKCCDDFLGEGNTKKINDFIADQRRLWRTIFTADYQKRISQLNVPMVKNHCLNGEVWKDKEEFIKKWVLERCRNNSQQEKQQ